ncbi:hypothetical protein TELCIR_05193 [Teladorsagia circumcincta]|uniref:glucuronosyltransferase n=1 Tax=Teladorsagia circumcincta TaxID=45464 RepID=A0A2G9USZ5_TELCI|nr:hypothetical protein TELCIR_05193 [Teladorsagia circumcincta]
MILIFLSSLLLLCDSFKVLVINPKVAYSHMNFMGKIADTLVDAGHEVVTFQPIVEPAVVGNGTTKSRLIQRGPFDHSMKMTEQDDEHDMASIWTFSASNPLGVIKVVLLDDKELLQQLKDEKFDVAITELFDFIGIGVLEAIGLKNIVGAHSAILMEGTSLALGVPVLPSFVPAFFGVTNDSSDLWRRTTNLLFTCLSWYFQTGAANAADQVMRAKLGPNATPETVSNMSWVVVNSEPLMEFEKPTLNKVVDIGGLGVHKPKPLSEEWDRILSLREHTVLISFGSVAKSKLMPETMKRAIINVVKS